MNKLLKTLVTLVIVIGLLFVAAVIILPKVIDPNNYKGKITALVQEKTGMELVIDGDIDLSFYPWLGLKTGQLILSDPGHPDSPALMQVDKAVVRIKLLPLLKKQVEADTVVLDGLKVNLITFKDGKTNWDKLASGGEADTDKSAKPESAALVFAVAGLKINDGLLHWDDRKSGQDHLISKLNLASGAIRPGASTDLKLSANVKSSVLPEPVDIETRFDIAVADDFSSASLSDMAISLADQSKRKAQLALDKADIGISNQQYKLTGLKLDASGLPVNGNLAAKSVAIDLGKESVEIPALSLSSDAGDASLSAVSVKKMLSAPAVSAAFKLGKVNLAKIMAALPGGETPDMLKQVGNISLSGKAAYDNNRVSASTVQGKFTLAQPGMEAVDVSFNAPSLKANIDAQTLDLPKIDVNSSLLRFSASAKGRYNPENTDLSGRFNLPTTDIKRLLKLLAVDVQTADPAAMTRVALGSAFRYKGNTIALTGLKGQIDETPVNGSAGVTLGEKMAYRFDLKLGKLDADRYMPPETATAPSGAAAKPAKTVSGAEMLAAPIGLARDMNMNGKLALEQLKITGLTVNNIVLGMKANNGLVSLSPIQAGLYEGRMNGSASFDARKKNPPLSLKLKLSDMQIGTVLKELEVTDKLDAKGELETNVTVIANSSQPLAHTLSGPVSFRLKDGVIQGFDLRKIIIDAQSLLNQTKYKGKLDKLAQEAKAEDSDQFRFTAMSGSAQFKSGVGHNDDLSIKSPLFRITGEGDVDLPDEKIDYHMNVFVVQSLKGQGGEELDQLKGQDIPVWIHGSLTDPGFRVDLERLLKKELQKRIDKEKDKYKEKLQKKLEKAIFKKYGGNKPAEDNEGGKQLEQGAESFGFEGD
ncbi:MAG: hypothetical protein DSZ33_04770, partial [Gammaproteobacteria bacterium]